MPSYPSLTIEFPFGEMPRDYRTIRTPFEGGYEQRRLKSTTAPRRYQFDHKDLSASDVSTWLTFWDSQLGGSTTFTFTDPRTSASVTCWFDMPDGLPADFIKRTGPQTYDIGPIMLKEQL